MSDFSSPFPPDFQPVVPSDSVTPTSPEPPTPPASEVPAGLPNWDQLASQAEASIRQHPLLWVGGALLAGLALGQSFGGRRRGAASEMGETGLGGPQLDSLLDQALAPLTDTLRKAAESVQPQVREFAEKNLASLLQSQATPAPDQPLPSSPYGEA
jgi:hypothetical protein